MALAALGVIGLAMTTRTFLVTGSTEGIGLETAKQLSSSGHTVLVHGRDAAKVSRVVEQLGSTGAHRGYVADLSSMAAVRGLASEVAALTWVRPNELVELSECTRRAHIHAPRVHTPPFPNVAGAAQ